MFRCQETGTVSYPHEKPVRKVVETYTHEHPERYRTVRTPWGEDQELIDRGGFGTQIGREIIVRDPNAVKPPEYTPESSIWNQYSPGETTEEYKPAGPMLGPEGLRNPVNREE